jgi:hypothetical protein
MSVFLSLTMTFLSVPSWMASPRLDQKVSHKCVQVQNGISFPRFQFARTATDFVSDGVLLSLS